MDLLPALSCLWAFFPIQVVPYLSRVCNFKSDSYSIKDSCWAQSYYIYSYQYFYSEDITNSVILLKLPIAICIVLVTVS